MQAFIDWYENFTTTKTNEDADTLNAKGFVHLAMGKTEKALDYFDQALCCDDVFNYSCEAGVKKLSNVQVWEY